MNSISISWDYENNMNNDDFKGAVAVRAQFSSAAQSRPGNDGAWGGVGTYPKNPREFSGVGEFTSIDTMFSLGNFKGIPNL